MFPTLSEFSNDELLTRIKLLKGEENQLVADVVLHLHEIDLRGIYRDAGYSSLFNYCRQCLGYSEGASNRRVRAARCLQKLPELYDLLREGKVTLSVISEVAPVMTSANSADVLSLAQGATKLEAAKIAVQFGAVAQPKRERIIPKKVAAKPVVEDLFTAFVRPSAEPAQPVDRFSLSFEVSKEVLVLYEQAKALTGAYTIADVFERTMREFVQKRQPKPQAVSSIPELSVKAMYSRAIPAAVRRAVVQRDGGQCQYVSPDGTRCSECRHLEIDHKQPVARGGSNELDNLQLLCRAHNQLSAEQWFGREFMEEKRRVRG